MSMASSDVDEDNFATALGPPAKKAKKVKRGSAVTKKDVAPARKRKPAAPMAAPRKRQYIESDGNDNDNGNDENFMALCEKALRRDPLDVN